MLLRAILYLIAVIITAFSAAVSEDRRYGRTVSQEDYLANRIRASLRRRGVMKKCKFLHKNKRTYILKNSNVMIIFDDRNKIMTCLNVKNTKQSTVVEWFNQPNYAWDGRADNIFEQTFDSFCLMLTPNSDYASVSNILKTKFQNVIEIKGQEQKQIKEELKNADEYLKEKTSLINLNEATEEELAELPGINIVMAKKIVQRINMKGEYRTVEEMCMEMKIKEHFRIKLNDYLCVRPVKKKSKTEDNDKRIIDF